MSELIKEDNNVKTQLITSNPAKLLSVALSRGADLNTLERFMDMQERHEKSQALKAFNIDMCAFQSEIPTIEKKGHVQYSGTNFDYCKIEDIAHAIKPLLKKHGFSYRFHQSQDNGLITVTCIATHKHGHSETATITSMPDQSGKKDQLKAIASAIKYLKRYTLTSVFGIIVGGEDDDGGQIYDEQTEPAAQAFTECSDDDFNKRLETWTPLIESGEQTAQTIKDYLNSKNFALTPAQYQRLQKIKAK